MTRQTSLLAYRQLTNIGRRQQEVLEVIKNYPQCDNPFISKKLGIPINSITPRVKELRDMGKVKEAGQYKNAITGRLTLRWEAE